MTGPWIVLEDFNSVRGFHEKLGGRTLFDSKTRDFNLYLEYRGLQAIVKERFELGAIVRMTIHRLREVRHVVGEQCLF